MTESAIREARRREIVGEAHARKPDPDQPWRFVCPHCKGQVRKGNSARAYECQRKGCRRSVPPSELFDKKTGDRVMITDESVKFVHQ